MSEQDERMAVRGPRGERGSRGERGIRGVPGLSVPVQTALLFLFLLAAVFGGLNLFWTAHEVHVSAAATQASYAREQQQRRQAGAVLSERLCRTFSRLAALKPPAEGLQDEAVRVYLRAQHATLDQFGADAGCK
jgi:Flp pilus assembly protein TadG